VRVTEVTWRGVKPYEGWFKERYGDHVAQVSTDSSLKLKQAVRDVARMLHRACAKCNRFDLGDADYCPQCKGASFGFVPDDIEMWCKRFVMPPMGVSDHHFVLGYEVEGEGWQPGSIESDEALKAYVLAYPEDWAIVKEALGLARQKGRHACAFVIANKPIPSFIPMTRVSGQPVTQFTAPSVEGVGGLKMDFLNIKILAKIQGALQLIRQRSPDPSAFKAIHIDGRLVPAHRLVPTPSGDFADIWDLPEDQEVFTDVAEGRVETVFQFGTPGAIQWLEHFRHRKANGNMAIDSVESMAAFTALDRPGGLDVFVPNPDWQGAEGDPEGQHNMLVEFARRARGSKPSPGVLAVLDELVPETYGVMTYQEQLQRVYQQMTGCSLIEAEQFRINVSKKLKEKIDAAQPAWMERAGAKIGQENAEALWKFMKAWARYGFNKSHAVCYAVIAYACAYLKHHYPLEWWCSVLTHTPKEKIANELWRHCRHVVALPDVQKSGQGWLIEGDYVRAPISLLHGIGEKAHEQLVKYAPYTSIDDFARKIKEHQEATRGPKQRKVKGTEDQYETVVAPGRNALHRGLVHNLIVSGAMESLFSPGAILSESSYEPLGEPDPDICAEARVDTRLRPPVPFPRRLSTVECMRMYDAAMTKVFGKPYTKSKKVQYPVLDALGRYQARKAVLPVYGDDLRPLAKGLGLPHYLKLYDGRRMRYCYMKWDRRLRENIETEDPVIGGAKLDSLVAAEEAPLGGWSVAVLAYVQATKTFQYPKSTKDKTACKLTLEVEGGRYELVHWPDRDGKLPAHVANIGAGDIVAALLVRWDQGREFAVRELKLLRAAPDKMKPATEGKPDESDADDGEEG
jgi:hypothetical protein